MGAKPDDLQREIAVRRRLLDDRINTVRERLRQDVEGLGENIEEDLFRARDGLAGVVRDPAEVVNAHAYSSIAVGLAAGALLGALPGANEDRRPSPKHRAHATRPRSSPTSSGSCPPRLARYCVPRQRRWRVRRQGPPSTPGSTRRGRGKNGRRPTILHREAEGCASKTDG